MIGRRALSRSTSAPDARESRAPHTSDQRDDRVRHTARLTRRIALHLNRLAT